jgi:hypothetical protein
MALWKMLGFKAHFSDNGPIVVGIYAEGSKLGLEPRVCISYIDEIGPGEMNAYLLSDAIWKQRGKTLTLRARHEGTPFRIETLRSELESLKDGSSVFQLAFPLISFSNTEVESDPIFTLWEVCGLLRSCGQRGRRTDRAQC